MRKLTARPDCTLAPRQAAVAGNHPSVTTARKPASASAQPQRAPHAEQLHVPRRIPVPRAVPAAAVAPRGATPPAPPRAQQRLRKRRRRVHSVCAISLRRRRERVAAALCAAAAAELPELHGAPAPAGAEPTAARQWRACVHADVARARGRPCHLCAGAADARGRGQHDPDERRLVLHVGFRVPDAARHCRLLRRCARQTSRPSCCSASWHSPSCVRCCLRTINQLAATWREAAALVAAWERVARLRCCTCQCHVILGRPECWM